MRHLVIGDLHGFYDGLMQALDRASYEPNNDVLVHIGDIVDGFKQCTNIFDFFLTINHKILIRGNHDLYALNYFRNPTFSTKNFWERHGGEPTLQELKQRRVLPNTELFEEYRKLLESQVNYWVSEENKLCVHAGIGSFPSVEKVLDESVFYLDRTMWKSAYGNTLEKLFQNDYEQIFIGHSSLFNLISNDPPSPDARPLLRRNIWNLDTGAGWGGKVTIMNLQTNEYWQSDFAPYSARK